MFFRRTPVLAALLVTTLAGAQNRGVPQSGFPNWNERMIQVYTNRARADPPTELAGCSVCAEKACYPNALKPVIWSYNLNRAARFHAANLEYGACSLQHDSPCALLSTLSSVYDPNGSCLGQAACACQGGTLTCGSVGTSWSARVALFGTGPNAENIAWRSSGTARQAFDQWIFEPDSNSACGFRSANGHRYNILNGSLNSLGAGYYRVSREMYGQDFANAGTQSGTLISGGHDPHFTTSGTTTINFRVNYYNTGGAPQSAQVNIDGACTAMTQERGITAANATWLAALPLTGTTCRRYVFEFKDPAGATVLLPETGSYGVGDAACANWAASAPSSCPVGGNQAPTIATAAAASPNPVTGTTTALTVLGADDGGEPALTYTWSGPAGITFSANGDNAAKASTATFTAAGSFSLTVTVRDAQGLTATSVVSVTVSQTLTSVAVTPGTVNVTAGGTQQFTASARDQFGNALAAQPSFTWTTSGGGAVSTGGLYTAGATPGGPFSVTATASTIGGSAVVNVTAGTPPTVATAASANPNPVTGTTTVLTVLGADDGGEGALTYTWAATGPAGVTYSANGTNGAKSSTATFAASGTYTLTVTIKDTLNLTVTSSVVVTVTPTLTSVQVSPAAATVVNNGAQSFTAQGRDQFNTLLSAQPTWAWTVGGGGSISSGGVFTAGGTPGGPFTVTASSSGKSGTAQVTVSAGNAPTVATPAGASPAAVTGNTSALSVLGADDGTEANLTYTWSASGPASATFSANGTNGAKSSTATFTRAGTYTFTVTITDAGGQTVTSQVTVTVQQTLTSAQVTPATAAVAPSGTLTFTASARDQFGNALATQPAFAWTVSGGGAIGAATGVFTASAAAGGPFTVTATAGAVSGTASVSVSTGVPPTIATAAAANPNPVTGTATTLSVLGADDGGEAALTYAWSASGPAAVTYSANGNNAAKSSVATFTAAGSYTFTVTVQDTGGFTATSSVTVTVQQTPTAVAVLPPSATTAVGGTVGFSASASDQFSAALAPQPAFSWAASGGGSISTGGAFTAATAGGPFTVTATAGPSSGTAAVTVTSGPDVSAPTVALTSPTDGATVSGLVPIAATAADDRGLARVEFFVDGTSVGTSTVAPYAVTWNTAGAAVGAHLLGARATDTSGNTADASPVSVTVAAAPPPDTTPPTVRLTSPSEGATVSGRVTVTADASDDVAVVRVAFFVDGAQVATSDSGWQFTLDAQALALGPHALGARAFDAAGNSADAAPMTVHRERAAELVGTLGCGCSAPGSAGAWLGVALLAWLRGRRRR